MIRRYLLSFDTDSLDSVECEVLVVGSGVAGLFAALSISASRRVLLITKSDLEASTTRFAQGGIAAVMDERDSQQSHVEDTLAAGAGLCDPVATEVLAREGPQRVMELLDRYNARFDGSDGRLDLAMEGGHSRPRVVHARGDATGSEVERALGLALREEPRASVMEHVLAVDLLLDEGACVGVLALDISKKKLFVIWARAVILSSGGMGQVYLVTTNPTICTGDGVAMAFRAGARVSDVEFVQFHPTALHIPEEPKFLISEAIRGEGALLVDAEGERIMEGVHPLGELAPRDVVVSRMVEVMREQHKNHLYLDARHLPADLLRRKFPNIYEHCLQAGIDITRHRIPVSPAAHYMSGGVLTDLMGRTRVEGLFACGEVACTGVHGANRLASNSLLEGLVFSKRIARFLADGLPAGRAGRHVRLGFKSEPSRITVREDLLAGNLRELMRDSVGIVRCDKGLREALRFMDDNEGVLDIEYRDRAGIELKNMFVLARLIATAACIRKESRGCHRRRDYPDRDDWNWRKHIDIRLERGGLDIGFRPHRSRVPGEAGAA